MVMIYKYVLIYITCILFCFTSYADDEIPVEESEIEISMDVSEELPEEISESEVEIEAEIEINNTNEEIEINDSNEEVNVSSEVDIELSESDSETSEQSDITSSSDSSNGEIVVIDEVVSDGVEPLITNLDEEEIVAHPENLEDVPRDADGNIIIPIEEDNIQNKIDRYEDLLSSDALNVLSDLDSDDLTDWDIVIYFKNVLIQAVTDLIGLPDEEELLEEEDEHEISQASEERLLTKGVLQSPFLRSNSDTATPSYKNVVVMHGIFNEYECDLIVPYESYKNLTFENGYLVNVGTSAIIGKILYDGDPLDPAEYESYTYVINPIYGNTSNVYNYGSFNYRRHYYLTSSGSYQRITYDDMYGNFYVNDVDIHYSFSERTYYTLLFIILFMGVNFLWNRRH